MSRFKPFRRPRRASDNRYLPRDKAAWRGLIRQARYQSKAPLAKPDALLKAADRCARAVPPPGEARRDSVFLQLVTAARGYWRLADGAKVSAADQMGKLARACADILDAPPPPPPGQGRADIFG